MRFRDADDDIRAFGLFCPGRRQHFIGLAGPARRREKSLGGRARLFALPAREHLAKAAARRYRVSPCPAVLILSGLTMARASALLTKPIERTVEL
jgi:hypothetical protein